MLKAVVLLLAFATVSLGQKISTGSCPAVTGKASFSVADFLGTWFQIEKYYSIVESGSCGTAEYTLADDGTTVNVKNSQEILGVVSNSVEGTAVVASEDGSGELSVTLAVLGPFYSQTAPLWILDTDYISYAIIYSCSQVGPLRGENVWVLSRTREISSAAATAVDTYITNSNGLIVADDLVVADQTNCA